MSETLLADTAQPPSFDALTLAGKEAVDPEERLDIYRQCEQIMQEEVGYIPVVYRNNRRALLTFEKGSTGTEAFDRALAEWAALGPTATNN